MRWMKVDEAAKYAGGIAPKTLYAMVRSGKLRAARIGAGRNLLFGDELIDDAFRRIATQADRTTEMVQAQRRA